MTQPSSISSASITAKIVSDQNKMAFLPKHYRNHMLWAETQMYHYMKLFVPGYSGGTWNFIDLSNGAGYMSWKHDEPVKMEIDFIGFEGKFSADTASLIVALFVLTALAEKTLEDWAINGYWKLHEFAMQSTDSEIIQKILD